MDEKAGHKTPAFLLGHLHQVLVLPPSPLQPKINVWVDYLGGTAV